MLLGPDGQPMMPGGLLGEPKSMEDIEVFGAEDIAGIVDAAEKMISEGVPMAVPGAIPIGDLCRIAKTLQALQAKVDFLESGAPVAALDLGSGE
jgi:hypothetical protein